MSTSFLLVGLGNPGQNYAATRHNIGFMAIDDLAAHFGVSLCTNKWNADFTRTKQADSDLLLVKPLTYMNRSGEAIARFRDYFRIETTNIIVVHDDLDLPPGRIKIAARGGAGGHNGIRSLISLLADDGFIRVKMGIGRPQAGERRPAMPVDKYVLSDFGAGEQENVSRQIALARQGLLLIIEQGVAAAMNEINRLR